jgi:hypothetical protein
MMSIRNYFILATVAAWSFGIGFVLIPEFVGSIFAIDFDADGAMTARFFGALLITVGLWFFRLRETVDRPTARIMITAYVFGLVPGLVNAIVSTLNGTMNVLGWLVVLMYTVLLAGGVYQLLVQPSLRAAGAAVK